MSGKKLWTVEQAEHALDQIAESVKLHLPRRSRRMSCPLEGMQMYSLLKQKLHFWLASRDSSNGG